MATRDIVAELTAELNDATRRARLLVERTDGRVFTVRPEPKRWSAAECISHLTLTGQAFVPIIQGAIFGAKKSGSKPKRRMRMDVVGGLVRWVMEPPVRRHLRTAAPFVPRAARPKAEAFAEFASLQSQLMYEALEASEIDFGSVMVVSAFNRRVHYSLYSAFRIIAAHERRHLWQAENAVDEVMKRFTPSARLPLASSPPSSASSA
ncbi:MAG: DinB family protein [Thermoanaerobaculia bacterium]